MNRLLPILSGSLHEIIKTIVNKTNDPIASEILYVDDIVNNVNEISFALNTPLAEELAKTIDSKITDEVRMIAIRMGEFEVSFLPKDKEPEYGENRTWLRKNRQTGKPARIFQKLLKREFKTREWEIFTNLFKAELCECANFELVQGEDIRYWYLDEHYYRCDGSLGNSCMRHPHTQPFFDIYVDKAKMLITKKDGLLTGRALVWEMEDGITIMDRVYTCFDYLENCFMDYAKEHNWWIRENNSLLDSGSDQWWFSPEDGYKNAVNKRFTLKLDKSYELFPYMDSFRYYDGYNTLSTHSEYDITLDSTEGEIRRTAYECENCGRIFYGYDEETPEGLHWSEWADAYYCDDCCWYSGGLDDYIPNSEDAVYIYNKYGRYEYPQSYLDDTFVEEPDGTESRDDVVLVDDKYYFVDSKIIFNVDTNKYEIRSTSD